MIFFFFFFKFDMPTASLTTSNYTLGVIGFLRKHSIPVQDCKGKTTEHTNFPVYCFYKIYTEFL